MPRILDPDELRALDYLPLLNRLFVEAGEIEKAEIVGRQVEVHPVSALGSSFVERMARSGSALAVDGWIADFAARRFRVVDQTLRNYVPASDIILKSKPKVHETLLARDVPLGASDRHGFTFVLPEGHPSGKSFYFVEHREHDGISTFFGPFRKPSGQNEALAADIAIAPFGAAFSTPLDRAERIYRPLIARTFDSISTQRVDFGPPMRNGAAPLYSIIIPFYGDAFFLSCVFHLMRLLDRRYEIILVVDDPKLWPKIYSEFERRRSSLRVRVVLLRNLANYGFAHANNLGANAASGKVLFLMNSDVFVENLGVLAEAGERIAAGSAEGNEAIAGFLLLYEDQTVQHIGMDFVRLPWTNDLYITDHPQKGLPLSMIEDGRVRSARAVTGALMGISAKLYRQLGGFDTAFERGDFEDADLCLRASELGVEIVLYAQRGLYHLERQSYLHMASSKLREIVTFLNCIEFNKRWAAKLDRIVVNKGARAERRRREPNAPVAVAADAG